ncbi:MAG: winged helix-turn-helix transcriptional regulator [Planctomycetes bacterium]|nr:winged helix-turn-helix transcriptional regulator [Planctomycetota bacterium]MCW8135758.1 winged helix-turn-helix transcriptional regulator [Planctomycetota bacterium]
MAKSVKSAAQEVATRCVAARTRMLARVVSGIYDDALRAVGLTAAQMTILTALEHTGGVQPARLCEALKLDKSTLSRNIDRMERNGWIRRAGGKDARSHKIALTEAGRRKFEQALPHWRDAQHQAEELLGGNGMSAVVKVTTKLRGF